LAVPVVATDAPGLRDAVRDGETGFLVPDGAEGAFVDALAARIAALLADAALAERLSAAALAWSQRFRWEAAAGTTAPAPARAPRPRRVPAPAPAAPPPKRRGAAAGSARKQRLRPPSACGKSRGSSRGQRSKASGQRVWKRQPEGGRAGDGTSPRRRACTPR